MATSTPARPGAKPRQKDPFLRLVLALLVVGVLWWILQSESCGTLRQAGTRTGRVQHEELTEISGIAASRRHPDVLWAHNDSGDSARIFALKTDGTHLGIFFLGGARAVDYEDIAIGPGPEPDIDYIYVADTGNNDLDRTTVTVYRVPEPALEVDGPPVMRTLDAVEALRLRFPDRPYECETLLVDPLTADLFLVSRDRDSRQGGYSTVFRCPAPHASGVTRTLEPVARFAAPVEIKGGDISPDGTMILLRAHAMNRPVHALRWSRNREQPLADVLSTPAAKVPVRFEPQGEAIAFSADGRAYYTISEGSRPPIYRYPVTESGSKP